MPEYKTQFAFTGKEEHRSKVNIPSLFYPNQHIDIKILHGSREHVTLKRIFT